MKESLKKIYAGTILLMQTLVSLISIILFNHGNGRRGIRQLMRERKRDVVSVLANGPSAKEIIECHSDLLENHDLLVMNYFANSPDFFTLKPRYYVLLDPVFFDDGVVNFSEVNPKNEALPKEKMKNSLEKVDWDMVMLFPHTKAAIKASKTFVKNPNIRIIFYRPTRIIGFRWFQNLMYKHNQGIPSSRNVIIPSIIALLNMGYKDIYLYGAEFSWTKTMDVDPDNGLMYLNDRHFYSKKDIRYYGKGGYKQMLEAIVEMLDGTERVADYAASVGAVITNRTIGSFVDAFRYENVNR